MDKLDKMKNTTDSFSKFCISSPMPVKMLSSLKKKKLPESEVRVGKSYQAELPALLSVKVSFSVDLPCLCPQNQYELLFSKERKIWSLAQTDRGFGSGLGGRLWMGTQVREVRVFIFIGLYSDYLSQIINGKISPPLKMCIFPKNAQNKTKIYTPHVHSDL